MTMSFREKSLWAELSLTLAISTYYLINLSQLGADQLVDIDLIMELLMEVLVVSITFAILSFSVLAVFNQKDANNPMDEREHLCELKSSRYGYWLLQAGIALCVILFGLDQHSSFDLLSLPPFAALHGMVAIFLLAELVVTSAQLWGLNRGV